MMEECHVCQGRHDDQLHQSTKRIRQWMLRRIAAAGREAARVLAAGRGRQLGADHARGAKACVEVGRARRAAMMRSQPQPVTIRRACVTAYLHAIARLALEVADRPELLGDFVAVIKLAPRTILGLQAAGRAAARPLPREGMRCYTALDILR
jgi:hypothetical protein